MSNKFKPLLFFACTVCLTDHKISYMLKSLFHNKTTFLDPLTFKQRGGYLNFSACIMKNVNIICGKTSKILSFIAFYGKQNREYAAYLENSISILAV